MATYFARGTVRSKRRDRSLSPFSKRYIWNDGQYADETIQAARRGLVDELYKGRKEALDELKKEDIRLWRPCYIMKYQLLKIMMKIYKPLLERL